HAAHDLPGARLRHLRHDVHVLGSRDLADHVLVRLDHAVDDVLAVRYARFDRDVHFGHASLDLILHGHNGGLGDFRDREAGGLDLLRTEAVAGDIDHVVNAAEDPVIAICRLDGAVAAHERPVAPVLAAGILVVLGEVGLDVAVAVAPDRLHDARPGIADADVTRLAGTLANFCAGLVVDDRMNPRRAGTAATRLHRMNRRNRGTEKAAGFGQPPGIRDHGFPLADLVVIPAPRLRLDRLAHRRHRFEPVLVPARFLGTEIPQHPNSRGRGMENVHAQTLGNAPRPPRVGKRAHALVQDA